MSSFQTGRESNFVSRKPIVDALQRRSGNAQAQDRFQWQSSPDGWKRLADHLRATGKAGNLQQEA
jgi:hypothetical protein